jgi:hypothetical protein
LSVLPLPPGIASPPTAALTLEHRQQDDLAGEARGKNRGLTKVLSHLPTQFVLKILNFLEHECACCAPLELFRFHFRGAQIPVVLHIRSPAEHKQDNCA